MDIVNFLATLIGFFSVIACLALLLKPRHIQTVLRAIENEGTLLTIGLINITFSLAYLLSYNTWDHSWRTIITVIGWLILLKGAFYLFMPEKTMQILATWKTKYMTWVPIILVVGVILGCALVYLGMTM